MMRNDLPSDDHIVRYVKPSMIQEDGTVDGSDFRLRSTKPDEVGLSVNWLEALGPGKAHQLAEVRRLCRLRLRPSGRFAEMNVGTVVCNVAVELALCALSKIHWKQRWNTMRTLHTRRSSGCHRETPINLH